MERILMSFMSSGQPHLPPTSTGISSFSHRLEAGLHTKYGHIVLECFIYKNGLPLMFV